MGCWHGTCGLTGLPITCGTEMYVFPIKESYRDSFCYSSALYRPSVLPFRAEYNDYGAGENCSGPGLDLLMDGIRQQLVEVDQGKNPYHDIAIKRDKFDVDLFFEACHEKRLSFQNPLRAYKEYPPTISVFFTMIRKDIADRLWTEWKFDLWKPAGMKQALDGFEADQYYLKNVTYAQLADTVEDYMEQAFDRFTKKVQEIKKDKDSKSSESQIYFEMVNFFEQEYKERDHPLSGIMSHMTGHNYSDGGFARFVNIKEEIVLKYISGDKQTAVDLIRECLIGYMINSFMEGTRRVWMPPMHQGSQSEALDEYRLMNRLVNDVIVERNREFESYD